MQGTTDRFVDEAPSAFRGAGMLAAREWRAKLYVRSAGAVVISEDVVADAGRTFRAAVAFPVGKRVAGFALLRPVVSPEVLGLAACWWENDTLRKAEFCLAADGRAPVRPGWATEFVGDIEELLLMAREADAWRRCVLARDISSLDDYLDECCA